MAAGVPCCQSIVPSGYPPPSLAPPVAVGDCAASQHPSPVAARAPCAFAVCAGLSPSPPEANPIDRQGARYQVRRHEALRRKDRDETPTSLDTKRTRKNPRQHDDCSRKHPKGCMFVVRPVRHPLLELLRAPGGDCVVFAAGCPDGRPPRTEPTTTISGTVTRARRHPARPRTGRKKWCRRDAS
jgi:hypothetical protein